MLQILGSLVAPPRVGLTHHGTSCPPKDFSARVWAGTSLLVGSSVAVINY